MNTANESQKKGQVISQVFRNGVSAGGRPTKACKAINAVLTEQDSVFFFNSLSSSSLRNFVTWETENTEKSN